MSGGLHDMLYQFLLAPFADFAFMRRALVASFAMALGSAPIGVLLMLRRMSLFGEAMSHAILPGAAAGFLVAGFSLPASSIGGVIAGLVVALLAGAATRATDQRAGARERQKQTEMGRQRHQPPPNGRDPHRLARRSQLAVQRPQRSLMKPDMA